MRRIEQSERRPHHALKERAVRSRASKNADAEKHAEQQACGVIRIDAAWRRSIGSRGENASFEKCFDLAKLFGDPSTKLALMRRDLERRIYEEASFTLSIIDRVVDYLGKEAADRLFGRQRWLKPAQPVARRAIEIPFQGPGKKSLLVPEGVIEARRRQTHRCREIAHRCRLVAMLPETIDRRLQGSHLTEFFRSGHFVIPQQRAPAWSGRHLP